MSDLEDRLRADALRLGEPAPDLDRALSVAVAAVPARRVPWVLAAAAVVVMALGVAGVLLLRPGGPSRQAPGAASSPASSAPSSAPSAAPGGLVETDDVGFSGVLLDARDPSVLHVYVWPEQRGACGVYHPHAVVDSQTAAAVVIRVAGRQELPPGATRNDCTVESARVSVPVTLRAPLGDRVVYDSLDHHEQYVLDPATVAAPTYLPPGFTGGAVDLSLYENKPVTRRTWTAPRGDRQLRLQVLAAPRSYVLVGPGTPAGTVDGHPAHLTAEPECLWWDTSASRAMLVCVQLEPSSEGAEPPPLPTAELLRVARSLA
jgi:hypothetical protein